MTPNCPRQVKGLSVELFGAALTRSPYFPQDISCLQNIITNLKGCRANEMGSGMECGDAALRETLFAIPWNALDKRTLELHQTRPINLSLIGANPMFSHAPIPIEDLCGADEHFLRVAAAQSAGASKGS